MIWEDAGNDAVAKRHDMVFRLHEQFIPIKNYDSEYRVYSLQIRKKNNISFKDLGYTFYIGNPEYKHNKSVNGELWDDINKIIGESEKILKVLDFI